MVEFYMPERAFERFIADRWQGLSGEARTLALDAFVWGGWAFGEGLVAILELEPVTEGQRQVAQDIRSMMEASTRGR